MSITTTWNIANLERNVSDGKVTVVHYTIGATDGTYQSSAYGSIGLDGDVVVPFKDLTEDLVVGWVKDQLGDEKVQQISDAFEDQIEQQRAPKVASGVPW